MYRNRVNGFSLRTKGGETVKPDSPGKVTRTKWRSGRRQENSMAKERRVKDYRLG